MEEVLGILLSKPDPKDIVAACNLATRILKNQTASGIPLSLSTDPTVMGNCFMAVLLSSTNDSKLLSPVTNAIVELLNAFPELKAQYGSKGLFFEVVDLMRIYHDASYVTEDSRTFLTCSLMIAISLLEDCPANYVCSMDAGIFSIIPYAIKVSMKNVHVMLETLKLLHLLIENKVTDDDETKKYKNLCLHQCLVDEVEEQPIICCIIFGMNRFLAQSSELQLYGIKCLQSFCHIEKSILLENGAIDTVIHASCLNMDIIEIQSEAISFLHLIIGFVEIHEVSSKLGDICHLFTEILKHHVLVVCSETVLKIAQIMKIFLMKSECIDFISESGVHSYLFQALLKFHQQFLLNSNEKEAVSVLQCCFYLLIADSTTNFRDAALLHACEKGSLNETLFFLFLGGKINFVSACNKTPLIVACENNDVTMVKVLISIIATMQDCGLGAFRIENVSEPIKICLTKSLDKILPLLLWYLLYRDKNDIAEWNALNIQCLDSDCLNLIFKPTENSLCSNMQYGHAVFQLAEIVSNISFCRIFDNGTNNPDASEETIEQLQDRYNLLTEFSTPLPPIKKFFVPSSGGSDSRCNAQATFQGGLFVSYDGQIVNDKLKESATMVQDFSFVPFPPNTVAAIGVKELNLQHNKLSSLESFVELHAETVDSLCRSVKRVNLSANTIPSIPRGWPGVFKNLRELLLSNNCLEFFPLELLEVCTKLETLDVSGNRLSTDGLHLKLPSKAVPHHSCLTTLKLSNNQLSIFPIWISNLQRVQNLYLNGNCMDKLIFEKVDGIHNKETTLFPQLKLLKLQNNKIQEIDTNLFAEMPSINHLNLSSNRIFCLPQANVADGNCRLQYLDLAYNCLTEFPEVVILLHHIQTLNLSGNKISSFPKNFEWKPKRLVWLDLSQNLIQDPAVLFERLCYFSVSLRVLNISYNNITSLSSGLGSMKSLEILDVSYNELITLPDELGSLTNLKNLNIVGNNLSYHTSVLEGKTQEICAFLYGRLKKSIPHNRAKLMMLGHSKAGKTTLLNSLVKYKGRMRRISGGVVPRFLEKTNDCPSLATVGVDVIEWTFKHRQRELHVSAWDFAGQEDFYATHPCFLTERAMYVVVYDGSLGVQQLNTLKPWLTAIHSRARHCPVAIVASHADAVASENKDDLLRALKDELKRLSKNWFPNFSSDSWCLLHELVDVREGSVMIPRLRTELGDIMFDSVIQGNPLVGGMVPSSYVQLENMLQKEAAIQKSFPVITFSDVANLVQNAGADKPLFESGSELMLAIRYLHQTGILLHFDDPRSGLHNHFFIKPAWLCKLLAQVISIEEHKSYKLNPYISQELISKKRLIKNLVANKESTSSVPKEFIPSLFQLLSNFEVILQQDEDTYLVPSKLSPEKPEIDIPNPTSVLVRYVSMVYIPMGFWPRLIARLLSFSNEFLRASAHTKQKNHIPGIIKTWQRGVFFQWNCAEESKFVLVQSGEQIYKGALGITSNDSQNRSFDLLHDENIAKEGLEIILPRCKNGIIMLGQVVDHINNIIEEWYPGLLRQDITGRPYLSHHSPCIKCIEKSNSGTTGSIHSFCLHEVTESVLHHCTSSEKFQGLVDAHYSVETTENGDILVACPNHPEDPVHTSQFAPEINFDDFDPHLRLIPEHMQFELSPEHLLGDGGFGSVYHAQYDNKEVAIKTFHVTSPDALIRTFRAELSILAKHQHPSIVSFVGFVPPGFLNKNFTLPMFAMEFARLGALSGLLQKMTKMDAIERASTILPFIRHRIALETCDGLSFLHSQHIVYRDLKPDNVILFSLDPSATAVSKITDYGISTKISACGVPSPCGSPGYSAPEVVSIKTGGKKKSFDLFPYSFKCDIYSFGLLLHETAVGSSPWVDYVIEEQHSGTDLSSCLPDDIVLKGIKPSAISSYKGSFPWPCAQKLVDQCLQRNPDNRPTALELVKVLSGIESCCIRMREFIDHAGIASVSCINKSEHNDAEVAQQNNIELVLMTEGDSQADFNQHIARSSISLDNCQLRQQELVCAFTQSVVTSLVVLSGCYLAGTSNGEILYCDQDNFCAAPLHVFEVGVSCMSSLDSTKDPNSSPTNSENDPFLIVGLDNATIVWFKMATLKIKKLAELQMVNQISLNDIASIKPIAVMQTYESTLHVACGKFIVSIKLEDPGLPTISSVKTISAETKKIHVAHLGVSKFGVYVVCKDSSEVKFWQPGSAQRNRLDVSSLLPFDAQRSVVVTALFVDRRHSTLWVGLNTGHVVVLREPLHGHVVRSDSKPAAVLRTHAQNVTHICAAPVLSGTPVVPIVICVGTGSIPLFSGTSTQTTINQSSSMSSSSGTFVVAVDADVADKGEMLASVLARREALK